MTNGLSPKIEQIGLDNRNLRKFKDLHHIRHPAVNNPG